MLYKLTRKIIWVIVFSVFMIILSSCNNSSSSGNNNLSVSNSINTISQNNNSSNLQSEQGAYTITFDLKGGTSASGISTIMIDSLDKTNFKFDISKPNYVFAGWSYNGTKVFDNKGNIINNVQLESFMKFEAIYIEKATLKIIYSLYNPKTNLLINTSESKPENIGQIAETNKYDWNTQVSLFANLNSGYSFVGWYYNGLALSNESSYNYMMWDTDITLEARYKYMMYDVMVCSNNNACGQVMIKDKNSQTWYNNQTQQCYYTESVTVAAYTKSNIRFLGWYDENNNLISTNAVYTFDMPNKNYILEAKWDKFIINYDLNGGINDSRNTSTFSSNNDVITLFNPTKKGYTFLGWEHNGDVVTTIDTSCLININLKALWTYYTFSLVCDNEKAGTVPNHFDEKCTVGTEMIIDGLITNPGYTFIGWYKDDVEFTKSTTISFVMTAENVIYKARWEIKEDTKYKVEHYQQKVDGDDYVFTDYVLTDTDNMTGMTDTLTNAEPKNYVGFTVLSFEQLNINGNESTVLKIYYKRNSYNLTTTVNDDNAGTIVDASGVYKYGKEITIEATTNPGYTFIGWFNNNTEITKELSYTFKVQTDNLVFEAKWTANKYKIIINNQADGINILGIVSGMEYCCGSVISLTAENIPSGYTIKWDRSDNITYTKESYAFIVPASNITITTTLSKPYYRNGNKIYFGTYPQTLVDDSTTIESLNRKIEILPSESGLGQWNDYGYYINGSISSYMYYIDVKNINDDCEYRGVYFIKYRPSNNSSVSSIYDSYQNKNGYNVDKIYWFKYEPIEWDILNNQYKKAIIISNLLLDCQDYYCNKSTSVHLHNGGNGYSNNYKLSNIRKWLNETFYNTAFSELQKSIIKITTVDNSLSANARPQTYDGDEAIFHYLCENTEDKIYVLAMNESSSYYSGKSNLSTGTDYAKCQGLDSGKWWMRSPSGDSATSVYVATGTGCQSAPCYYVEYGVRPVCLITL